MSRSPSVFVLVAQLWRHVFRLVGGDEAELNYFIYCLVV